MKIITKRSLFFTLAASLCSVLTLLFIPLEASKQLKGTSTRNWALYPHPISKKLDINLKAENLSENTTPPNNLLTME